MDEHSEILENARNELVSGAQQHLQNRRDGMEKQADGIELLKLLYHDEAHITLPRDTRCRAMKIVLDTFAESQRIFAQGEQDIKRALLVSVV